MGCSGAPESVKSKLAKREYDIYKYKNLTGKTESDFRSHSQIDDFLENNEREFNISQYLNNYITNEISKSSPKYSLNILYYDENLKKIKIFVLFLR